MYIRSLFTNLVTYIHITKSESNYDTRNTYVSLESQTYWPLTQAACPVVQL